MFDRALAAKEHGLSAATSPEILHHAQQRAGMLWSLDSALSVFGIGDRPFLGDKEVSGGCDLMDLHLILLQKMAGESLKRRELLWRLRPKDHYITHLVDSVRKTRLNPMHLANFVDEDHMKQLRGTVHACHPRSMLRTWSRRYILKRVLLWLAAKQLFSTRDFLQFPAERMPSNMTNQPLLLFTLNWQPSILENLLQEEASKSPDSAFKPWLDQTLKLRASFWFDCTRFHTQTPTPTNTSSLPTAKITSH